MSVLKRKGIRRTIFFLVLLGFSLSKVIMAADYGEVTPVWTRLNEDLTYLKDNNGRLHLFPIRMGDEGYAYCVNPGVLGPESGAYDTHVEQLEKAFKNENIRMRLRTMVLEGFRLSEKNGCTLDFQKWYATQMAISAFVKDGFSTNGAYRNSIKNHQDENVYKAFHHILDYASDDRNLIPFVQPTLELEYKKLEKDKVSLYEIYEIIYKSNLPQVKYEFKLPENLPKGTFIDQSEIQNKGSIQLKIPKKSIVSEGHIELQVEIQSRVWDVVYLEAVPKGKQNTVTATMPLLKINEKITIPYEKKYALNLTKKDVHTGELLKDVIFDIWGEDDEGSPINKKQFTTNHEGVISIDGLPRRHKYFYKEVSNPKGYKLASDVKSIQFDESGNAEIQETNEKMRSWFSKIESQNKTPVSGAVFNLLSENNDSAVIWSDLGNEQKVAPLLTSDEFGRVYLPDGLPFGKYYIREEGTGEYLHVDKGIRPFVYESSKSGELFVLENHPVKSEVFIQKKGPKNVVGDEFVTYEISDIINGSNQGLNGFQWLDEWPGNYVDILGLETGTYESPVPYELFFSIDGERKRLENLLTDYDDNLTGSLEKPYDYNYIHWIGEQITRPVQSVLIGENVYFFDCNNNSFESIEYLIRKPYHKLNFNFPEILSEKTIELWIQAEGEPYKKVGDFDIQQQKTTVPIESSNPILGIKLLPKEGKSIEAIKTSGIYGEDLEDYKYGVYAKGIDGQLRLVEKDVSSKENKKISFGELTNVFGIKILFNNQIPSGFSQKEGAKILGRVKRLEPCAEKYFKGDLNQLIFPNRVFVEGETLEGKRIINGDEWDTYSHSQNENKSLPSTGFSVVELTGSGILLLGYIFLGQFVFFIRAKRTNLWYNNDVILRKFKRSDC